MAISGVVRLFVIRPVHPVGADGKMALSDHLRELRARILKVLLAVSVAFVVALFFFEQLYDLVYGPYQQAVEALPDQQTIASTSGAGGGLMLYLKLCGFAALIGTSPIWLYQIWAFILPGLHANERKWSRIFMGIATPLFVAGLALGYFTLPKGLEILIGFNPKGITNIVEFSEYLQFFTRTLLMFGIAFEIPLFVVLLNLAGVVSGRQLGQYRSWIIVFVFVFAAVATPSTDPFTMCFMAIPMVLLFIVAEGIARWNDKRRARKRPNAGLSPDEISPL
ncbi:twin-arginine translocase subunit TatC [Nocardioides acrostichi]|uniref:Sec-independent protein translocase protein TatC n=1 Tax=Nocardioides acrostichi TaxID=2784339 RepID=A0A930UY75_9ACTN|nr:twin-arginine translocase subunit TatC [Nocardioides acrostichi]MBF4163068.1 twin-arginine translocase subunit TatC [Nocardioides acrostichi]